MTTRAWRARWFLAFLAALFAAVVGLFSVASASAAPAPHSYDTVAYTYDVPARLLPPDTVATDVRGSSSGPGAASWVSHAPSTRFVDAAEVEAGSIRAVNPLGGGMNCVNCSVATDATLGGSPASALLSGPKPISVLERLYGGSFKPVSGQAEIEGILADAGNGARGIVYGSRGSQVGHVFNGVNQGGTIRFLDGQTGGAASFSGFDSFMFLRTNG